MKLTFSKCVLGGFHSWTSSQMDDVQTKMWKEIFLKTKKKEFVEAEQNL